MDKGRGDEGEGETNGEQQGYEKHFLHKLFMVTVKYLIHGKLFFKKAHF